MDEVLLPEHVLSCIEEHNPWDLFVIGASENIQVPPQIELLDEALPEELDAF